MRLVEACYHRNLGARHNGRLDDSRLSFGWEGRFDRWVRLGEVCCSQGVLSLCVVVVERFAGQSSSFALPNTALLVSCFARDYG